MKISEPSTGDRDLWNTGTDVGLDLAFMASNAGMSRKANIFGQIFSNKNVERLTCKKLRLQGETNHELEK